LSVLSPSNVNLDLISVRCLLLYIYWTVDTEQLGVGISFMMVEFTD